MTKDETDARWLAAQLKRDDIKVVLELDNGNEIVLPPDVIKIIISALNQWQQPQ